jgi:MraZ protein
VADLVGQHRYQLDPKGRIALPGKFRDAFGGGVWVTLGEDGCIYAFPQEQWERRRAEALNRPLPGRAARDYARMFFGNADVLTLDKQGRLIVPQRLRQQIGLAREAVVVGVGDRLEIWAGEAWDRYEEARTGAYVAGTLESSG